MNPQGKTSSPQPARRRPSLRRGFTLIELILVMTILVIVISVAAPSLSRFFKGRTLDSEAKRFLALTRYGQSRAVSEGVPMLLWINQKQGAYGLQADSSYVEQDSKTLEYHLDRDLQVEVVQSAVNKPMTPGGTLATVFRGNGGVSASLPRIRFTPDGFIGDTSPAYVVFRGADQGQVSIGESQTRLNYEIQGNPYQR